jgi:DeoR family transcriptional regulator of aga operon
VLLERAQRTVVLADASKVGRIALARVCSMSRVDVLITDERLPEREAERIAAEGCRVIRA